ncbi:MAG: NAD(P)H-hydrate dehydratase [Clostridia bacterium]|nr:NAD(P)H-hydrate dehydratase [Clostridia bacterium]
MMTITPTEMKALENRYMSEHHIPGALLMEHAAMGVMDAIARYTDKGAVVFLCGPGNNGGDGYAAARLWKARGGTSHIIEITADVKGDALLNRHLAVMANIPIHSERDYEKVSRPAVIVDALFGTGFARPAEGFAATLIHWCNDHGFYRNVPVIAVDIPSGIDGTTGEALGEAVRATETVTFHRVKQGLILGDAPDYVGKITCVSLLTMEGFKGDEDVPGLSIMAPTDLPTFLFRRPTVCHKGDFGRVVMFCGSPGMAGAAALCANAALRAGAGLVNILCRESIFPILQTLAPGATCTVLPEENGHLTPVAIPLVRQTLHRADAACIGCGLGMAGDTLPILHLFKEAECPVLWDADALTLLARTPGMLPLKPADVITPHPGEAGRLLGCMTSEVTADALDALDRLHKKCGCTVLLKGARTLITDGDEHACNIVGSPALAKGGSGDVLAGIIAALLARRVPEDDVPLLDSISAAQYGALIHGMAGIRAARQHGENCTQPTDIVNCIRLDAEGIDCSGRPA